MNTGQGCHGTAWGQKDRHWDGLERQLSNLAQEDRIGKEQTDRSMHTEQDYQGTAADTRGTKGTTLLYNNKKPRWTMNFSTKGSEMSTKNCKDFVGGLSCSTSDGPPAYDV
jgi:hypothetical protein